MKSVTDMTLEELKQLRDNQYKILNGSTQLDEKRLTAIVALELIIVLREESQNV